MYKMENGSWPDFETRQRTWTGFQREFRQHHGRADRPTVWKITVTGNRVFTSHGLLDGAMQSTDYAGKAKNVGRANAITEEQDAMAEARRDVRKKWDFEGFDEYVGGVNIDRRHQDMDVQALLTNLPGSFCLYKPKNTLEEVKPLMAKARQGKVYYTLKRDGIAKWVIVDYYGNVQIYSRRSRPWSDTEAPTELPDGTLDYSTAVPWATRFPHLVSAVKALNLPPGSMMAVELVAKDKDDFRYVSGLTKGHTARALEDMKAGGLPMFYWWDLPFFGGEDLLNTHRVSDRYAMIMQLWCQAVGVVDHIIPIQTCKFNTPDEAIAYAKQNKFEGWVVTDPEAVYGDKGWNLKGKPDRPTSCAKLKPWFEDDFVVFWDPDTGHGDWGTGKNEKGKVITTDSGKKVTHGGVGSVALYQYNSKGELVYISNCNAGGLGEDAQAALTKKDFPMVWEVKFTERTYTSDGEDTNALKFASVLRIRTDKKLNECINDRL
jgi:ATP-dependent DNA ligase